MVTSDCASFMSISQSVSYSGGMSQTPSTKVKPATQAPKKARYHVRNWPQYERALVDRGRMTLWIHEQVLRQWCAPKVKGQRGAPRLYSDLLILCLWALKARYHLTNRGVEGFMKSILWALGVYRPVPDHTTVSRRGRHLPVTLTRPTPMKPIQVLIDSTGIKILGASTWREWQRYVPGGPRDFRKLHIALDAATQEIVAVEVTDKYDHDKDQVAALLAQVVDPIQRVTADGNYDFDSSREAIRAYGAQDLIPPRANAVIQPNSPRPERDRAIQLIETLGSKAAWKEAVGYHQRSLVETAMYRIKGQFGERMASREKERQITEMRVWAWVLNQLTRLGMPVSRPVALT